MDSARQKGRSVQRKEQLTWQAYVTSSRRKELWRVAIYNFASCRAYYTASCTCLRFASLPDESRRAEQEAGIARYRGHRDHVTGWCTCVRAFLV